jgi:hypothetical protein
MNVKFIVNIYNAYLYSIVSNDLLLIMINHRGDNSVDMDKLIQRIWVYLMLICTTSMLLGFLLSLTMRTWYHLICLHVGLSCVERITCFFRWLDHLLYHLSLIDKLLLLLMQNLSCILLCGPSIWVFIWNLLWILLVIVEKCICFCDISCLWCRSFSWTYWCIDLCLVS